MAGSNWAYLYARTRLWYYDGVYVMCGEAENVLLPAHRSPRWGQFTTSGVAPARIAPRDITRLRWCPPTRWPAAIPTRISSRTREVSDHAEIPRHRAHGMPRVAPRRMRRPERRVAGCRRAGAVHDTGGGRYHARGYGSSFGSGARPGSRGCLGRDQSARIRLPVRYQYAGTTATSPGPPDRTASARLPERMAPWMPTNAARPS